MEQQLDDDTWDRIHNTADAVASASEEELRKLVSEITDEREVVLQTFARMAARYANIASMFRFAMARIEAVDSIKH